ncbi:unnamed protein product [Larinioides sclopetarius]|uniref:Uncharacterized protein n=1 Tax=Larinioides sclopetarius TaxID=280406 RepID=A0AAV2A7C1_9ARAC
MMSSKLQLLFVCVAAFCLLVESKPQYGYGRGASVSRKESVSYNPTGQKTTYVEETVASPYGGTRQTVSQQSSYGYGKK